MRRYAMETLVRWKEKKDRKPLVLQGARQVGKTWLMREFGHQYFEKTAYISFYNNQRMKRVFEEDYDIARILMNINIETHTEVTPGNTLIIFDEIQEAPKALESLKYFCEDAPEYPIVVAGSLLGIAIHKGISFPVGKVELANLYPMSFMEFLEACGEAELARIVLEGKWEWLKDFREKFIFWLKNYYYVGGMPAIVDYFREHKNYDEVRERQKDIISQYEKDFGKHSDNESLARMRIVWNSIPVQLAKENKKFFLGQIKKGARMKEYELAIECLSDCGLIYRVYKVTKPAVPLKSYIDLSAFKLFLVDIGLLGAMSELDAESIMEENRVFTEFKGALTEQFVLQQIVSDTKYSAYYCSGEKATYEMDFLIQKGKNVVPIEVKSEENLHAKSLKAYCQKYKPDMAVRTSLSDYREEEWMVNIPLYAIRGL